MGLSGPGVGSCLAALAKELVGSPSRVLITCRRPLAALANGQGHRVRLGPLPAARRRSICGSIPR